MFPTDQPLLRRSPIADARTTPTGRTDRLPAPPLRAAAGALRAASGARRSREGERLDIIAAQHLGDPEQFWRLCDANGAMRPDELTETVGRRLRITLPEGIPGPRNA